jgi:hypothetical protein
MTATSAAATQIIRMAPTMTSHTPRMLTIALLLLTGLLAQGHAKLIKAGYTKSQRVKAPHYQFNKMDRIEGTLGKVKDEYFVGEPVVIPILLSNHSRFPLTLSTNINPRSMLKVQITASDGNAYEYHGPFQSGLYGPTEYFLYPMEEVSYQFVLWADFDRPDGLAFSDPGLYQIQLDLQIKIVEGPNGEMQTRLPLGGVTIKVVPTPEKYAAFVATLKHDHVAANLQMRKTPAIWNEKVVDVLNQQKGSIFYPYLLYSAGNYFNVQANNNPTDKQSRDKGLMYLQLAGQYPFPYRVDALLDLLSICDKLDLFGPAAQVSHDLIKNVPSDRIGKIGSLELIKKYLVNTEEIDPVTYWTLEP